MTDTEVNGLRMLYIRRNLLDFERNGGKKLYFRTIILFIVEGPTEQKYVFATQRVFK